jgi:hypothetical protein
MDNFSEVKVNLIPPDQFSISTEYPQYTDDISVIDETHRLNQLREATFLPVASILEPNYLEIS